MQPHSDKGMVFCYQNCSDPLWEKNVLVIEKKLLKFEAEGREFAKQNAFVHGGFSDLIH